MMDSLEISLETDRTLLYTSDPSEHSRERGNGHGKRAFIWPLPLMIVY